MTPEGQFDYPADLKNSYRLNRLKAAQSKHCKAPSNRIMATAALNNEDALPANAGKI